MPDDLEDNIKKYIYYYDLHFAGESIASEKLAIQSHEVANL